MFYDIYTLSCNCVLHFLLIRFTLRVAESFLSRTFNLVFSFHFENKNSISIKIQITAALNRIIDMPIEIIFVDFFYSVNKN